MNKTQSVERKDRIERSKQQRNKEKRTVYNDTTSIYRFGRIHSWSICNNTIKKLHKKKLHKKTTTITPTTPTTTTKTTTTVELTDVIKLVPRGQHDLKVIKTFKNTNTTYKEPINTAELTKLIKIIQHYTNNKQPSCSQSQNHVTTKNQGSSYCSVGSPAGGYSKLRCTAACARW